MRKIWGILPVILSIFYLSACSTVLNTTTEEIQLATTPPNAIIIIDGNKFGTTPQTVNIERGSNHLVKFELEGYEPYEILLTRKISSWFWLNGLNGFIPGMVIDMFTGSMYYLLPEKVDAGLTPVKVEESKKKKR
ncbi:MAG: PEGA domain-containing protein [Ignavibacteriaceae bacterium]